MSNQEGSSSSGAFPPPVHDHDQQNIQGAGQYAPLHPPVPYQQFEYSFPPSFPDLPPPPSVPADLFSASEHTNLLGFLDQIEWEFDPLLPSGLPMYSPSATGADLMHSSSSSDAIAHSYAPQSVSPQVSMSAIHGGRRSPGRSVPIQPQQQQQPQISGPVYMSAAPPAPSPIGNSSSASFLPTHQPDQSYAYNNHSSSRPSSSSHASHSQHHLHHHHPPKLEDDPNEKLPGSGTGGYASSGVDPPGRPPSSSATDDYGSTPAPGGNLTSGTRPTKPVLTTPEKRARHILSEQRRRNTIRDGYSTLVTMLAPHPSASARPPPSSSRSGGRGGGGRGGGGRPKGARGRTRGKGKSGVLFRAVEYVLWLEEGVQDLQAEVERLEAVTQGRPWPPPQNR